MTEIAIRASEIENLPGDPVDRIVVASAMVEDAVLLTTDGGLLDWPGRCAGRMRSVRDRGMLPLEGVKVVEFCQVLAGPYCGMLLADMGADVVKIEPPGRRHDAAVAADQ